MRIHVRVVPRASQAGVEETGDNEYKVRVHAAPEGGKANAEVIKLLAQHFRIKKNQITLLAGATSKKKTFSLNAMGP